MSEILFDFIRLELAHELGREPNEKEIDHAIAEIDEQKICLFEKSENLLIE